MPQGDAKHQASSAELARQGPVEDLPLRALSRPRDTARVAERMLAATRDPYVRSYAGQALGIATREMGDVAQAIRYLRAALAAAASCGDERKADVQCYRRVRVGSIDIKGRMSGEIIATGAVNIHKTGVLDGNVTAKSITIDKGGVFSGQLVIGQADLTQGELLPEQKPAVAGPANPELAAPDSDPLPAI